MRPRSFARLLTPLKLIIPKLAHALIFFSFIRGSGNTKGFPPQTHPKSIFSPGATLSTLNPADLTNSSTLSSPTKWPAPKAKKYPPS